MAQFYTLEEAATRLQISPEEFKRRLKLEWTSIRPFRDGPTLRFRSADIDELARSLGAASDPGSPLGPVGSPAAEPSDDYAALPPDKLAHPKKPDNAPLGLGGGEDIFVAPAEPGSGKGKAKGDSDVRLDVTTPKPGSDPESHLPTEEIAVDLGGPGSGKVKSPSSGKLTAPKSGPKLTGEPGPAPADKKEADSSSEFELSLDSDSDSFELQLTPDSSEEVDLGSSEHGTGKKSGQSGINLGKPADSGVSLEQKGPKSGPRPPAPATAGESDSDVDFELSLDPASGARAGGPKSGPKKPKKEEDSSSEFELTLDDSSGVSEKLAESIKAEERKGDIFETDFELPVMPDESGSEVVPVESADTDLDNTGFDVDAGGEHAPVDDESASEVVVVDEEPPLVEEEAPVSLHDEDAVGAVGLEEGPSASAALRGVRPGEEPSAVRTVYAVPPKWGPVPVIGLALTLVPAFLGVLMTFEIMRGMWGYHQGTGAGGTLVRGVADMFGMKVND